MARNHYAAAHEIAQRLAEAGELGWSGRVERVIAEGCTATEILMGIQFQLGELLKSEVPLPEDTRHLVGDLRRSIQEALE